MTTLRFAAWLMLMACVGCAAEDANRDESSHGDPQPEVAGLQEPLQVESHSGAARGIAYWKLGEGVCQGYNEEAGLVVEFRVSAEDGLIESVYPESGTVQPGGVRSESTMPGYIFDYYEAMKQDLNQFVVATQALSENELEAPDVNMSVPDAGQEVEKQSCSQCIASCWSGAAAIQNFCRVVWHPQVAAACWAVVFAGPVACEGFCLWYFC